MSMRIVLADDHKIVRDGLQSLLEKQPDMEVVGEADNGRTAVSLAQELSPDIVILDIAMPELNGIEATRQLTLKNPKVKVLALSMHSDRRFVAQMFRSGASGYLLKDCAFEELVTAIRAVVTGQTYLSPGITNMIVRDYVRRLSSDDSSKSDLLTSRECEVLQLLAEGNSTKEIASQLNVSVKTVETHRLQIMGKLDIHSVAQLTKFAVREGFTSLDR